jgi:hypothetical protein
VATEWGDEVGSLLERFTFFVIPHVNPDGEARNRSWTERWPDVRSYLSYVVREPPGHDVEFGYPDLRPENLAVASFLQRAAPIGLHMSLHGMAFGTGALLLIDRAHAPHATSIRRSFATEAVKLGLGLHDENRTGEKGFFYVGPGFWTTPEGTAMRSHFRLIGDPLTAGLFRDSSMDYVSSLGGEPLSLVTEIPLFLVSGDDAEDTLGELRLRRRQAGKDPAALETFMSEVAEKGMRPVPMEHAIRMHISALDAGLTYAAVRFGAKE